MASLAEHRVLQQRGFERCVARGQGLGGGVAVRRVRAEGRGGLRQAPRRVDARPLAPHHKRRGRRPGGAADGAGGGVRGGRCVQVGPARRGRGRARRHPSVPRVWHGQQLVHNFARLASEAPGRLPQRLRIWEWHLLCERVREVPGVLLIPLRRWLHPALRGVPRPMFRGEGVQVSEGPPHRAFAGREEAARLAAGRSAR
mmetsp:Transcript_12987/g.38689  ORF Transcript_12987/g.38689 Transcript_12987/m.38689 type:complete len:200 (+) Transcript_12987:1103-1702(+)